MLLNRHHQSSLSRGQHTMIRNLENELNRYRYGAAGEFMALTREVLFMKRPPNPRLIKDLRHMLHTEATNGRGWTNTEERRGSLSRQAGRLSLVERVPGCNDPSARRVSEAGRQFLSMTVEESDWFWSSGAVLALFAHPDFKEFWEAVKRLNYPPAIMGGIWIKHVLITSESTWMRLPSKRINGVYRSGTQYLRIA